MEVVEVVVEEVVEEGGGLPSGEDDNILYVATYIYYMYII
jgi:hypothetical protein